MTAALSFVPPPPDDEPGRTRTGKPTKAELAGQLDELRWTTRRMVTIADQLPDELLGEYGLRDKPQLYLIHGGQ